MIPQKSLLGYYHKDKVNSLLYEQDIQNFPGYGKPPNNAQYFLIDDEGVVNNTMEPYSIFHPIRRNKTKYKDNLSGAIRVNA